MSIPFGFVFWGDVAIVIGTIVVWERLGVRAVVMAFLDKIGLTKLL